MSKYLGSLQLYFPLGSRFEQFSRWGGLEQKMVNSSS